MNVDQKQVDVFVYRLLASIGCALSAILAAYSTYLALERIPMMKELFFDFDVNLPAMTLLLLRLPWLPLGVSLLGFGLGALAIFNTNRTVLAGCWVVVLLNLSLNVLIQLLLEAPLYQTLNSVNGV